MGLTVKVELPSDPRLLCVIRSTLHEWAELAGFSEEECRSITLAVDEALSNIMRHAYDGRPDQPIEITCTFDDHGLEFVLADRGRPVDRAKLRSKSPDGLHVGGRGTHFIAQIMDQVEYEALEGRNRVRLVKYRANANPAGRSSS